MSKFLKKLFIGNLFLLPMVVMFFVTGCETTGGEKNTQAEEEKNAGASLSELHIGDKVRVEITGTPTPTLPQEQVVRGDGTITVLQLQSVPAAGMSPVELEKKIHDMFVPDYYKRVTVTIVPLNNRYFSVGGYVNRPDRYLYEGPTTLTRAVQAAGDITEFGSHSHIKLSRPGNKTKDYDYDYLLKHPEKDPSIYPGDSIYIKRRLI